MKGRIEEEGKVIKGRAKEEIRSMERVEEEVRSGRGVMRKRV